MGDTLVLGTSVERRESSNLSLVTVNGSHWQLKKEVQKLGYRIVAIAADCKSAPSGSVVRVHLQAQSEVKLTW